MQNATKVANTPIVETLLKTKTTKPKHVKEDIHTQKIALQEQLETQRGKPKPPKINIQNTTKPANTTKLDTLSQTVTTKPNPKVSSISPSVINIPSSIQEKLKCMFTRNI